jgi:hypothetical protein
MVDRMTRKAPYMRILIVDSFDNRSFIVVKDRSVNYLSADGTPNWFSNIAGKNSAELRFALEDANTIDEAIGATRRLAEYAKTVKLHSTGVD